MSTTFETPTVYGVAGAPSPERAIVTAVDGPLRISSALRLDRSIVRPGDTLTGTVTYTNPGKTTLALKSLQITARRPGATHAGGPRDDFSPGLGAFRLPGGRPVSLRATRKLTSADPSGTWEAYASYQDAQGGWHDGPSVSFTVINPSAQVRATGMQLGTNFWYHTGAPDNWSGETSMKPNIAWASAYGSGSGGLAATNIWDDTFIAELAPYGVLRFMDWGNTNFSTLSSWSERRLPTDPGNAAVYIDGDSAAHNPGMAYEWMIDLANRTHKDIWICVPAQTKAAYWTELASLLKSKLQPDRKLYLEYSNETWNGSFTQAQYTIDQGVVLRLPGLNQWYQGQAFAVLQSLRLFSAFEGVFGSAAMGTRVIRVFAYGGNMDTGRQALKSIYTSSVYNAAGQRIDMLALAPYIGSELDGASASVQADFHRAIDRELDASSEDGQIAFALSDLKTFQIPKLGTYEGGQHLLHNAQTWSANPKIYAEYTYMLDKWSPHFALFMHYAHTGRWRSGGAWGAKDHTGQPLSEAHKYRAIVDWVAAHR